MSLELPQNPAGQKVQIRNSGSYGYVRFSGPTHGLVGHSHYTRASFLEKAYPEMTLHSSSLETPVLTLTAPSLLKQLYEQEGLLLGS